MHTKYGRAEAAEAKDDESRAVFGKKMCTGSPNNRGHRAVKVFTNLACMPPPKRSGVGLSRTHAQVEECRGQVEQSKICSNAVHGHCGW